MKKTLLTALFLTGFTFPILAHAELVTVSVKGMVCSFCAQGIKKTFLQKEGVENVEVDLDRKIVTITTNKGTSLKDQEIKDSIVDAGFEVIKIERDSNA